MELERDASLLELDTQRLEVDRLAIARLQGRVHGDGSPDHLPRDWLELVARPIRLTYDPTIVIHVTSLSQFSLFPPMLLPWDY
jgi:hypothetical protein